MAVTTALPGVRRTQEERTAATRARLLDATLACLHELGYARTTTIEIARRARVSRGAQLHHFPTKQELVTAAVEHLFARRHGEFLAAFAARPPGGDPHAAAIDLLWSMVRSDSFDAWLELLVAARTDPELRARVAAVTERLRETIEATFRRLFAPPSRPDAFYGVAPRFVFALLDGLALQRIHAGERGVEEILEVLKALARLVMPGAEPGERSP
jgi:AcrR family transcriptional regulator